MPNKEVNTATFRGGSKKMTKFFALWAIFAALLCDCLNAGRVASIQQGTSGRGSRDNNRNQRQRHNQIGQAHYQLFGDNDDGMGTTESMLQSFLLKGYTEIARPAEHANQTTLVKTRIFPMKIQELIEKDEVFFLALRLQFGWVDKRLQWEPKNFSGLSSVILPGYAVWLPDLQFTNSAGDMYSILGSREFAVKVHSNGEVWYHPTGTVKLRCELDLNLFPFDHQQCGVVLESVIYTHEQLNMTIRKGKKVSFSMYQKSGLWDVTDGYGWSTLNRATRSTAFSRVEFILHMKRRTAFYINNYIIPCFLLSLLQVMTFLIPWKNPERLTHATTVLLSLIVFQTIVFSELPKTASSMPLLARYLMSLSVISVAAIGSCVCVSLMLALAESRSRRNTTMHVRRWVVKMLQLKPLKRTVIDVSQVNQQAMLRPQNFKIACQPVLEIVSGRPNGKHSVKNDSCSSHRMSNIEYTGRNKNGPVHGPDDYDDLGMVKVRCSQFYRHMAKTVDNLAFYTCSALIFGVPAILFFVLPSVLVADKYDKD